PPVEAAAGDLGNALPLDPDVEGAGGFSLEPRRLAGSEELRAIVEGRKHRSSGRRVHEPKTDGFVGIARLLPQPCERVPDIGAAVVEERRGVLPEAAAVSDKAWHQTALPIEPARVGARERHRLSP